MAVINALDSYQVAALKKARFSKMADSGKIYAEIPLCAGVWAEGRTRQEAMSELESVLSAWIETRLELGQSLPAVN